jgi:hypothetical protein
MGALLITDWKKNLHEMLEPGQEVIAYRSREECAELIRHYLDHETDRAAIAAAGQQRTLREHTDRQRMQQLIDKLQPMLRSRNSGHIPDFIIIDMRKALKVEPTASGDPESPLRWTAKSWPPRCRLWATR